jgi:hypothetical protein
MKGKSPVREVAYEGHMGDLEDIIRYGNGESCHNLRSRYHMLVDFCRAPSAPIPNRLIDWSLSFSQHVSADLPQADSRSKLDVTTRKLVVFKYYSGQVRSAFSKCNIFDQTRRCEPCAGTIDTPPEIEH